MSLKERHIVLVANSSWNIHNYRRPLIKQLLSEGAKVSVVVSFDPFFKNLESLPVTIVRLDQLGMNSSTVFQEYKLYRLLKVEFERLQPDLVLSFTIKPAIYCCLALRQFKIPVVPVITGLGSVFLEKSWKNRAIKVLYKRAIQFATQVIFQNEDDRALFRNLNWISSEQGVLIPGSGVDTNYFQRSKKRENAPIIKFLFVGRLLKDKGIFEFLKAAELLNKEFDNLEFLIAGAVDKENPASLSKKEIEHFRINSNFQFLGKIEQMKDLLTNVDVLVLPSYREGTSRAILEAMSMELPVITTDVPGCKETVVNNVNGFIVPPRSASHLLEALKSFVQLPKAERIRMGVKSREFVETKFSDLVILPKFLKVIKKILGM